MQDMSQVMDVGSLSRIHIDSLLLLVACLGFIEFGMATREFEVTHERLGVCEFMFVGVVLWNTLSLLIRSPFGTYR